MAGKSKIEWTEMTWNPTRGCSRVSDGCRNCYAEVLAARFSETMQSGSRRKPGPMVDAPFKGFAVMKNGRPQWTGRVELIESMLDAPLHWRKPRRVFVNSMSDLFHEALPDEAIDQVFAVMALCPQHTFQVLTKRPERMLAYFCNEWVWNRVDAFMDELIMDRVDPNERRKDDLRAIAPDLAGDPLRNVWLGVSVEDQATADERIPLLLQTPAAVRFVSYEPALGPLSLSRLHAYCPEHDFDGGCISSCPSLRKPDWVIAGGESGPGARPADPQWFRAVRDQCVAAGVPFFFKQWGEWWNDDTQPIPEDLKGVPIDQKDGVSMYRVGKKAAGALLDGREWREMPA